MGLDITAYRQLMPAPDAAVDEDGYPVDWQRHYRIDKAMLDWTEENWPGRSEPIKAGIYTSAERYDFAAGSYIGYGRWREWIAAAAGLGSPRAIWNADNPAGPFVEPINFADNEGIIGSIVAAKLAEDFAGHEARIVAATSDAWNVDKYRSWRRAFELAADGGCVVFH